MPATKRSPTLRASSVRAVAELATMRDEPVHPLRLLVLRKRITLTAAARMMGWSLRKLMAVVINWHRPNDAAEIAAELGLDPDEVFPRAPLGATGKRASS